MNKAEKKAAVSILFDFINYAQDPAYQPTRDQVLIALAKMVLYLEQMEAIRGEDG